MRFEPEMRRKPPLQASSPGALALDFPFVLLLLLLLATLGQGLPTPAAVGLPLTWQCQVLLTVATLAALGLWSALSWRLFRQAPTLARLADSPRACLLLLALFLLLAKSPYLSLPYFWDAMGYVMAGVVETWADDFPLILSPEVDAGHPPLFYLMLALLWKILSPSLTLSHLFNIAWGVLALWGVHALGRRLYDSATGLYAALLLALSPLFYAQVGTLHLEPSLAALTVWAVRFALERRLAGYLFCASAMVLIKEPSVVLVPAVAASVLAEEWRKERRAALGKAVLYALPILPLAAWLLYHKLQTGWFLTPAGVPKEARLYLPQIYAPFLCIFKEQYRWLLSLSCLAAMLTWMARPSSASATAPLGERLRAWLERDGVGLPLISLLAFLGYFLPTATVFFSPRYLLPVLPLFFVLAVAGTLRCFGARAPLVFLFCALLFVGAWQRPPERDYDLGSYLRYTSYLRTHQAAASYLAEHHPQARILANYPLSRELAAPVYGFTPQPFTVAPPARLADPTAWDLWAFTEESQYNSIDFPGHRQIQERYRLLARFVDFATAPRGVEPEVRIYESPTLAERHFVDLEVLADGTLVKITEGGLVLRGNRRLPDAPVPTGPVVAWKFNPTATGGWMLQRDGRLHAWGDAPHLGDLAETPGIEAVALAAWPEGTGYAILSRDGRVFGFGQAELPRIEPHPGHFGARDLAVTPQGGVYVLYGSGMIAAYGAPQTEGPAFGFDAVRAFAPSPTGQGWYILDLYGAVHTTPEVPMVAVRKPEQYYSPDAQAADLEFGRDGRGYVLDRSGEVYPF